jgi:NADPH:quinone reductase-like Zn-dependent oxidoreductase
MRFMKAVHRTEYGPPDLLEVKELPTPVPGDDEVLVRVRATTVNRTDCGGLWGRPYVYRLFAGWPRPKHTATGTDFAGDVEAVGKKVTNFKPGDRVWGFNDNSAGTHAQYVTFRSSLGIAPMPAGIDYGFAAACIEGGHYALNFLDRVRLGADSRVLVNGGTGAIGSAAIQLLKAEGVHVTAVCGPDHVARVAALGADRVIDYSRQDFTREDETYDFVFDAVGKSTFGACKAILGPRGVYVSSELGPGAENLYLSLLTPLGRGKKVVFPLPVNIPRSLQRLSALVEQGKFKPLVDRTYRLDQIREAFVYVASGQKIGNVLLDVG